ncbi:transglycosylase domain-containing protein [Microbacterium marmarense]|uniref:Transglycosylase domain-containing protein n=1 Tax=Microbacterium marmarense TaxID=3122051 RepID=A0ABU8LU71_9MICO
MPGTKRTASGVLGGLAGIIGLSAVAGILISATVTPAIALSGNAASSAITLFDNLPSVLEIDELMLPTTIYAKDSEGNDKVLTQFYDQNRSPVEYDEVAPAMYDAVLSSEDPRYYQHGGVDLIGTSRALLSNIQGGGETQGGSTISQQYVKNILVQRCEADANDQARTELNAAAEAAAEESGEDVVAPTGDELIAKSEEIKINCWSEATTAAGSDGIERKLQEMRYAIALEQKYSKNEILLGYLNIANFGGTTYGIDAAAKYYFGVSAADLDYAQAATLAGMVQNPNTYRIDMKGGTITNSEGVALNSEEDGYALTKQRQQYVLDRMLEDGKITQEQHDEAYEAPIVPNITTPKTGCTAATGAEYFCQYVRYVIEADPAFGETDEERTELLRRGGLNVYTTLDWELQNAAQQSVSTWTPTSLDNTKFGAVATNVEPSTGRILSIAQNTKFSESITDDPSYSSIVYAGDTEFGGSAGFSVGSTFKIFTLIDWLEQGRSVNEVLNGQVREIDSLTNSCGGDWVNFSGDTILNFNKQSGYVGTPMSFTRDSLNSGFFAMAEQLDLCDIKNDATKMGVTLGNGNEVKVDTQFSIIGSNAVSPIAMASAYGTVANNGIYCEPRAIDKVTDSNGNDVALPERTCEQVLDPAVAATAAYALEGVMAYGGTGASGNPFDGTAMLGKTGTHENLQTWLVSSSTAVATAVWVGNADGKADVFNAWYDGYQLSQARYLITKDVASVANRLYPGSAFPAPDSNLTRTVYTTLPSVVGMSIDEATSTLKAAGFTVRVGGEVDSSEAEGLVAEQSPGAGRVAGGSVVTISPSNGQGATVPNVSGSVSNAESALRAAGFGRISSSCSEDENASGESVTGTSPAAGEAVTKNTSITINYVSPDCDGGGGGGNDDDDDDDNG